MIVLVQPPLLGRDFAELFSTVRKAVLPCYVYYPAKSRQYSANALLRLNAYR